MLRACNRPRLRDSGRWAVTGRCRGCIPRPDRTPERHRQRVHHIAEAEVREAARQADEAVEAGEDVGRLHGVPVAIKYLTAFKSGVRHTFGCRAFADNVADHTAMFVERLEDTGAIVLGKTNTPEFGHRPTTVISS